jgi:tetratricopeptide (TPR) repeat protein
MQRSNERANHWLENLALVEAEFGNVAQAQGILREIRNPTGLGAFVLAQVGDAAASQSIAGEIARSSPLETRVQRIELPLIRAAIALQRGDATIALDALQPAGDYDLSAPWQIDFPYVGCPIVPYVRGYAHLRRGDGAEAVAGFQKILDHRGSFATSPLYPLAYVGLARARALAGDTAASRKAYEQFFSIWKDADADIPIYQQAKAEYAKTQLLAALEGSGFGRNPMKNTAGTDPAQGEIAVIHIRDGRMNRWTSHWWQIFIFFFQLPWGKPSQIVPLMNQQRCPASNCHAGQSCLLSAEQGRVSQQGLSFLEAWYFKARIKRTWRSICTGMFRQPCSKL